MFTVTLVLLIFISVELHRPPSCLVPGAGLGRLALEISSLGTAIKLLIKNWAKILWELLRYFLMFVFFFLTLNRFCKPGEWVLILHADLFKFHPEPVWQYIKYKLHTSYSLFILHNANISILTSTQEANEWTIYPWIHSNCNSLSDNDQLRAVSFPDIHPSRYLLSHSHVYHISVAIDYER